MCGEELDCFSVTVPKLAVFSRTKLGMLSQCILFYVPFVQFPLAILAKKRKKKNKTIAVHYALSIWDQPINKCSCNCLSKLGPSLHICHSCMEISLLETTVFPLIEVQCAVNYLAEFTKDIKFSMNPHHVPNWFGSWSINNSESSK